MAKKLQNTINLDINNLTQNNIKIGIFDLREEIPENRAFQ
jgi:hypothetical protein